MARDRVPAFFSSSLLSPLVPPPKDTAPLVRVARLGRGGLEPTAFPCAYAGGNRRALLSLRGSGSARRPAFHRELPRGARHLGGRASPWRRGRRSFASSRFSARRLSLCRPPPSRGAPARTSVATRHLTAARPCARPAHPCAPATPDEPEVVAPLAEASLVVVLIEPAEENFMLRGGAVVGPGASIGAGAMRSECVHDRAPAYGWLQTVGSDVVLGACMRCAGCGGHSHYYESSEQLVIQ
eukprot:COSAG06_NODE_6717_length_2812_cov_9.889053_1_plen_240_part_00